MQKGSFEGDVAVKDLRERMARAPDLPPEAPMRDDGGSAFGVVGRLVFLITIAAIAAYGFVWTSKPRDLDSGFTLAAYGNPAADEGPGAAPALNNTGVNTASSNDGSFRMAVFQFPPVPAAVLKADMMLPRDEAPPADGPQVHAPVPWPASDAVAKADDVVGSAPADTASLRRSPAAEGEIQTAPPASTAPRINDEEMANLLASGRTFLIIGDVTAARLAFRRAAESGDAQAALALGGTFDPLSLKSLGAVGVAADPAQARGWYQKAAQLGSRDARQRLNELAQSVR
jgi:TPR repeat protein